MRYNSKLIRRISSHTGHSQLQSALALSSVLRAMREALLEGQTFSLSQLGRFSFWRRKGRTIPNLHGKNEQITQPDLWVLRFKPCQSLRKKLRKKQLTWANPPEKL